MGRGDNRLTRKIRRKRAQTKKKSRLKQLIENAPSTDSGK